MTLPSIRTKPFLYYKRIVTELCYRIYCVVCTALYSETLHNEYIRRIYQMSS